MSFRLWLASAFMSLLLAGPSAAQAPSKLDLVRGLREAGMSDLALEYLKEIENKPLPEADKQAIPLERAKCLLDSAEDEPDEGTRTSMVAEAKEGFNDFLVKSPKHPRSSEASLALARLTAIEAKAQLNRARRIEVGDDTNAKELREKESAAARPLFEHASKLFEAAADQIKAKINDPAVDVGLKGVLAREAFEAELAAAINLYNQADTFLGTDTNTTISRSTALDKARAKFATLGRGSPTSRAVWVGRAWMAEILMEQGKGTEAENEFKAILASNLLESEEGKRTVRFFQARRNYLSALGNKDLTKIKESERELRAWLARYGSAGKPTPESTAFRFYLAFDLQLQADAATLNPAPKAGQTLVVGDTARRQYAEAEKIYRSLSQTDNDYTARATKNRFHVVRMLLGEAEQSASEYTTFEAAQMAALIQMSKLNDAEKQLPILTENYDKAMKDQMVLAAIGAGITKRRTEAAIKDRKYRILALLQRARELATDKDSPGDVVDNLLRLVYYYGINNQPYQAAVLGEFMAKTVKSTGGKSASAGLLAVIGYVNASKKIKVDTTDPNNKASVDAAEAARKNDRDRAMVLARYLEEKFPNDNATDTVRHQLASMLVEEKKLAEAFEVIVKVRPGYALAASARQLEGYLAGQLITSPARDVILPPGGKAYVFRRAVADLDRVVKPAPAAREEEVAGYLSVRARLASLYLAQSRAEDKDADKSGPGYEKALRVADDMLNAIPTFDCLKGSEPGPLNLKGLEMNFLALDARMRAIYLRGKTLVDAKDQSLDLAKAAAAIEPATDDVDKNGAIYNEKMKQLITSDENDPLAAQKAKVAGLAQGIDRTRKEIVMVGFKLRVRQGKPEEANKMLGLLLKVGGTIEENQPTLEFMARDLAANIAQLKRAGQAAEAKAMGEGLTILLKRLSEIPNRTNASVLFLGQTLYLVEQYEDALKEFVKIPTPVPPKPIPPEAILPPLPKGNQAPDWWRIDLGKLPNNPQKKDFQDQIRDYRLAQLYTARAYTGAKKFAEGEKLLVAAIGTPEKQGYGYGSMDFRKELAILYEAKGAATADNKLAKDDWGKALKEWTTLYSFATNSRRNLKAPTPEQERQADNNFFEAYFEVQRCLLQANLQLLKGNPKLSEAIANVGKKIFDIEASNKFVEKEKATPGFVQPDVWNRYCDLLDKHPDLKNAYKAAGGKFFLERPKES